MLIKYLAVSSANPGPRLSTMAESSEYIASAEIIAVLTQLLRLFSSDVGMWRPHCPSIMDGAFSLVSLSLQAG